MMAELVVPLTVEQIAAAGRIRGRLRFWPAVDESLLLLGRQMPGYDLKTCLIKASALNGLYFTNVYALGRMAEHISGVLGKMGSTAVGVDVVERIAALPRTEGQESDRAYVSFASKFAHFFIDQSRFPIIDSYSQKTVGFHLRSRRSRNGGSRYQDFVADVEVLRTIVGPACSYSQLDRYLWLTGQYRQWLRDRDKESKMVNSEVSLLFESPSKADRSDLDAMLPTVLPRLFRDARA